MPLLALFHVVFRLLQVVGDKLQHRLAVVILNRKHGFKDAL